MARECTPVLLQPATYFAYLLLITTPRFSHQLGNALAARGLRWFEGDALLNLHGLVLESVTIGLVAWFFPPTQRLLERAWARGRA